MFRLSTPFRALLTPTRISHSSKTAAGLAGSSKRKPNSRSPRRSDAGSNINSAQTVGGSGGGTKKKAPASPSADPSSAAPQRSPTPLTALSLHNATPPPPPISSSSSSLSQRVARRLSFVLSPCKAFRPRDVLSGAKIKARDQVDVSLDVILADSRQEAKEQTLSRLTALTAVARESGSWQSLARVLLNTASMQREQPLVADSLRECISLHTAMGNASATVHIRSTLATTLAALGQHEEASTHFRMAAHSFLNGSANSQQCAPGLFYVQPLAIRSAVVPYLSYLIEQGQYKEVERFVSLIIVNPRLGDADKIQGLVMLARSKRKAGLFQQAADVLTGCTGISAKVANLWVRMTRSSQADDCSSLSSTFSVLPLQDDASVPPTEQPSYVSPSSSSSEGSSPFDEVISEDESELRSVLLTAQMELARIYHYNLQDYKSALSMYGSTVDEMNQQLQSTLASERSFATHEKLAKSSSNSPGVESAGTDLPPTSAPPLFGPRRDLQTVQLARVLYDAAICHTMQDPRQGHVHALGIYEEALSLLTQGSASSSDGRRTTWGNSNYNSLTCRLRLNYARSLRAVDFPDRALEQYAEIEAILLIHGDQPQISENGSSAALPLAELNAHLAHCLHYNVGDLVRAEKYYSRALNICGVEEFSKTIFERIRPVSGNSSCAKEGDCLENNNKDFDQGPMVPSKNPFPNVPMRPDVICWLCESYAQLLARIGDFSTAKRLLQWRISVGLLHADPCVAAHLACCSVLDALQEFEAASTIFHGLLQLPTDAMNTVQRLEVVSRYAYHCHYNTQEFEKASALYSIALQLDGNNPHLLCQYASCLCCCPADVAIDIKKKNGSLTSFDDLTATTGLAGGLEAIRAIYVRALEVTEIRIQDAAHHATLFNEQRGSNWMEDTRTAFAAADARTLNFDPEVIYADCAVFFHDKMKDAKTAAQLYQKTWENAAATKPHLLGVVAQSKANYAQLLFFELGDRISAEKFYRDALDMSPMSFTIHSSYVDFLLATLQEKEALEELMRMSELFPQNAPQIYHRIARLEDRVDSGSSSSGLSEAETDSRLRLYCIANGAPSDVKEITDELIVSLLEHATDANAATDLISFVHARRHDHALTLQCYRILVPKFPFVPTLLANYARFCSDHLHKPRLAKKFLEAAMRHNPLDTALAEMMSDLIATHFPQQIATAEALLFSHTRQQPTNAAAHIAYASFLAVHMGSSMVADSHFRKALELKPRDAALRANYAAFLERQFFSMHDSSSTTNLDLHPALVQTMKMLDEAEAIDPQCSQVQFLRGFALAKRQRVAEAWLCYQKALTLDPNNAQIVKVAATFVHDRHLSISNHITASARVSSVQEGMQLSNLATLANALYTKAIQLEGAGDHIILASYSKFLREVMLQPKEASKVADVAHAAAMRIHDAMKKEAQREGSELHESDPDDLLS
jgi:tetratricopeptide (TPR) repeat protein